MASGLLSREQVLDELEFLATVEHALVVEYLSVGCALGHDLAPEEGGATTNQGHAAAGAASDLARGEMIHLPTSCARPAAKPPMRLSSASWTSVTGATA